VAAHRAPEVVERAPHSQDLSAVSEVTLRPNVKASGKFDVDFDGLLRPEQKKPGRAIRCL